ncbi:hypothetical protein BDN72DRAFT_947862 [Pluteus cervinus]|uniref:Uncharacterized protein n=1 Tax=Pluteus cervinus TaxID=181527 RepID=A0ACD3ATL8_9AGAR|nr:hypothetical protein BDN72DRAFT_947862 [Pluteus cervinus]
MNGNRTGLNFQSPTPYSYQSNYQHLAKFLQTLTPLCSALRSSSHLAFKVFKRSFPPSYFLKLIVSPPRPLGDHFLQVVPVLDLGEGALLHSRHLDKRHSLHMKRRLVKMMSATLRLSALEFMSSTSAATESESTPAVFEQSLDRLPCTLGGRAVLPPASQVMQSELEQVVKTHTLAFDMQRANMFKGPTLRKSRGNNRLFTTAAHTTCNNHVLSSPFVLLNPSGDQSQVRWDVQEQMITTLAMVTGASEAPFAKHYASIMPLLLNVPRPWNARDSSLLPLVFQPDATKLAELLMRIQYHPQLSYYLIATWSNIYQAMGPEFGPYLPLVMLLLLTMASAKADISVYGEDKGRNSWETVSIDGRVPGVRSSAIEEKCQAFETLVIHCSTLGARFAPYLAQTLELSLPSLKFYFYEGAREACAVLIPMLVSRGKTSGILANQMVSATFHQLIHYIKAEHDSSFLAPLYKCFTDSIRTLGGFEPSLKSSSTESPKQRPNNSNLWPTSRKFGLAERPGLRVRQSNLNFEQIAQADLVLNYTGQPNPSVHGKITGARKFQKRRTCQANSKIARLALKLKPCSSAPSSLSLLAPSRTVVFLLSLAPEW